MTAAEAARTRQLLYRFFGALFLYPDAERLTKLRAAAHGLVQEERVEGFFASAQPWQRLLASLADLDEGENVSIEGEYLRLFLVKAPVTPYESIYADPGGMERGVIVHGIEQEYRSAGLVIAPGRIEPPDHVAVEFEFLSFLCAQEAQAREEDDEAGSHEAQARHSHFLRKHLGSWFPELAGRAKGAEPKPPFDELLDATWAFLSHEISSLHGAAD